MNAAVARDTLRRVGIVLLLGLPVNAVGKLLNLISVTFVAFGGSELFGHGEVMDTAVARGTG